MRAILLSAALLAACANQPPSPLEWLEQDTLHQLRRSTLRAGAQLLHNNGGQPFERRKRSVEPHELLLPGGITTGPDENVCVERIPAFPRRHQRDGGHQYRRRHPVLRVLSWSGS